MQMLPYHVTCRRNDKQKDEDATYCDINSNRWNASDRGDGGSIGWACLLARHVDEYRFCCGWLMKTLSIVV